MLFSSMIFVWVFLPATFLLERLFRLLGGTSSANAFLLFASLLFYAWGEPRHVALMLVTVSLSWAAGLLIECADERWRRPLVVVGVVCDLALLLWYKYAGLVVSTLNGVGHLALEAPDVTLPIGISFFTFQALSYVIDVYRRRTRAQRSWFSLALYISFFPQLIAGPIVQYRDIAAQIARRRATLGVTASGIRRFAYGLAKKVLVANACAACADALAAAGIENLSCGESWLFALAYTLEIYYDFSGYSDMAIGLGRMFGFSFKENFDHPYLAASVAEFWRRWHISLGSWFRTYVYIPLGGNRQGRLRTCANVLVVFALTGLWHGASWSFLLWGLWHGAAVVLERLGLGAWLQRHRPLAHLYTIAVVVLGWVLFRLESVPETMACVSQMFTPWANPAAAPMGDFLDGRGLVALVAGLVGCGIAQLVPSGLRERWRGSWAEVAWLTLVFVLSIARMVGGTYNPFIYFRF